MSEDKNMIIIGVLGFIIALYALSVAQTIPASSINLGEVPPYTIHNVSYFNAINTSSMLDYPVYGVTNITANISQNNTKSNPYAINTTGVVGYWKFDGDCSDSSIYAGTLVPVGVTCNGFYGKYNNGSYLDGTTQRFVMNVSSPAMSMFNDFTISLWFTTPNTSDVGAIVQRYSGLEDRLGMSLRNNRIHFIRYGTTPGYAGTKMSDIIENNTWYNLVISGDDGFVRGYINGVNQTLNTNTTALIGANFNGFGYNSNAGYLNGSIDNPVMWNRTLSNEEILYNYYDGLYDLGIKTDDTEYVFWVGIPVELNHDGAIGNISFNGIPETATMDGITIYDYQSTANTTFDMMIDVWSLSSDAAVCVDYLGTSLSRCSDSETYTEGVVSGDCIEIQASDDVWWKMIATEEGIETTLGRC